MRPELIHISTEAADFSAQQGSALSGESVFSDEPQHVLEASVVQMDGSSLFDRIMGSLPDGVSHNIRKAGLAGAGAFMAVAAACGGGESDGAEVKYIQSSPSPTHEQTVIVVTPKEPTVTPTPKREPTSIVVQGPTEAEKKATREQADDIILSVSAQISDVQAPFYSRMSLDVFKSRQAEIKTMTEEIDKKLDEGDVTGARAEISLLKNKIKSLGDPLKHAVVAEDVRRKHDPENKYIPTNETLDPAVLAWYLSTVDILVATELPITPTPAGTPPVVK